jgi:two-component sensor histidine kinase
MVNDGDNYYFGHIDLYEYNKVTKQKRVLLNVNGYDILWNVYKLRDGNWWVSNTTDFYYVKNKVFKHITNKHSRQKLTNVWIHQFYKDSKQQMWAVGSKGLYLMENDSMVKEHYAADEKDTNLKLPYSDIHNIHEDAEGNFWLATDGDGLYKWMRKEHVFLHFTIADGLSSNLLYGILEDEKGYLWISSDNGLMRFNKKDYSVKTYTTRDGLTNNEFNRLSYFKAADGRMYFGSIDGVNSFYPRDFWNDDRKYTTPLQITSFMQFKSSADKLEDLTAQTVTSKKIVLQPGDNFFNIEFALLDFESGRHRYAYKLEGLDKEWNYIDVNSIRISRPPYGSYILKIKAQNSEGQWSSSELSIPVEVIVPLYFRRWFLIVVFLFLIAAVVGYIRYRVWQFKRRNLELERVVSERTNELSSSLQQKEILLKEIHHRVKNNLQVISSLLQLQSQSIKDQAAKDALIEGHNRVLSIALIHQKLYQNADVSIVEFSAFANELFMQINSVLSMEANEVKFINELPNISFNIDMALPMGLILNELMTNSFKYAFNNNESPRIQLALGKAGGAITLTYSDNGPGLPEGFDQTKATSLGLRLINRLTKQLKGTVKHVNQRGAVFLFYFPEWKADNS